MSSRLRVNTVLNETMLEVVPRVQGVTGIADLLDFRASSHGQKEAIICGQDRITYNQLNARAKSVAKQLTALGLVKADKIAFYMPNGVDFVACYFAAVGLGLVVVPINPLLKADEISHILNDADARALIVSDLLSEKAEQARAAAGKLEMIIVAPSNPREGCRMPEVDLKTVELDTQRTNGAVAWPAAIQPDKDLAVIIYTSGTTGKPKGAMLTHHNLLSVFPARLDLLDVSEHDRCLCMLPMCHIYGMAIVMIGSIARGSTLVILPKFEPKCALQLIEHERITLLPAVPAMFNFMLAELEQGDYDVESVRLCFCGGAPLAGEAISKIEDAFGAPLCEGYALTETACVATINPLHGPRKVSSVGPAVPGAHVRIWGENGQWLHPGEDQVGEILVWGPNIMVGYYKQPEATSEVLKNGWFFTGDLGYMDPDGYIYIVGRKKELIIRGGANVYPKEIEDVILRLPGVREVAVIGVPEERMGERVKAVVVSDDPSLTPDAVKAHCQTLLADYKVPRIVEFVDALPRNSTGKVLKRLLK